MNSPDQALLGAVQRYRVNGWAWKQIRLALVERQQIPGDQADSAIAAAQQIEKAARAQAAEKQKPAAHQARDESAPAPSERLEHRAASHARPVPYGCSVLPEGPELVY